VTSLYAVKTNKIFFIVGYHRLRKQKVIAFVLYQLTILQSRHFRVKTGNHLSGYRVVIEWLSSGD